MSVAGIVNSRLIFVPIKMLPYEKCLGVEGLYYYYLPICVFFLEALNLQMLL